MKFYCGIDLSARDFHLCVIDEQPPGWSEHHPWSAAESLPSVNQ